MEPIVPKIKTTFITFRCSCLLSLIPSLTSADEIRFSTDVLERFSHKEWVAYQTSSGHCRPTTEFLIGGTVATLAILRNTASKRDTHAWGHIYGEYIARFEMELDGVRFRWRSLDQESIENLANGQRLI